MRKRARFLVLFDIDGTLIRGAGPHHRLALVKGIRDVTGLSATLNGVATSGTLDRDLIRLAMRASGASERRVSFLLPRIVKESEKAYLRHCPTDLKAKLCPGVPELLRALNASDAALALVSGNLARIAWRKLECAGIRQHFALGAFSGDGQTRAGLAKTALELARARRIVDEDVGVVLIGDHPNDIAAAKQNGFGSVGVATGLVAANELADDDPDLLLDDLREVTPEHLLRHARPVP
ncbi:MAG: haloacid dehalogenase-like hydrolase [Acidobacteriaceae bacterium]|nr:haloacid dehalogenase-like hydrolase [Acidobacteriaceae bacterium]